MEWKSIFSMRHEKEKPVRFLLTSPLNVSNRSELWKLVDKKYEHKNQLIFNFVLWKKKNKGEHNKGALALLCIIAPIAQYLRTPFVSFKRNRAAVSNYMFDVYFTPP